MAPQTGDFATANQKDRISKSLSRIGVSSYFSIEERRELKYRSWDRIQASLITLNLKEIESTADSRRLDDAVRLIKKLLKGYTG